MRPFAGALKTRLSLICLFSCNEYTVNSVYEFGDMQEDVRPGKSLLFVVVVVFVVVFCRVITVIYLKLSEKRRPALIFRPTKADPPPKIFELVFFCFTFPKATMTQISLSKGEPRSKSAHGVRLAG